MPDPIITVGIAALTPVIKESVSWLWSEFGRDVVKRGVNEAKWRLAVEKYYTSLYERVGFVRVLGKLDAEPIEAIFTQINVLDRPTAELRYRLDETKVMWRERRMWYGDRVRRMDALAALAAYPKLFILGKPGAGKTTFLKYAAVQAIQREIKLFPIFVSLKEMSDDNPALRSGDDVLDFIVKHAVFRIPEPRDFVTHLLKGKALVLFDGLDEVNLAGDRRSNMINALNQFAQQFNESKYALTCRVAATDYSFTQFEYVEMADFEDGQIGAFVDKWFVGDASKRDACKRELTGDDATAMLRELAQVPLLLTLLCLVYEERNEFPPNRAEIYEEATRALLSKWDAARNIRRDTDHSAYEKLTLKGKQDLLAYLAARTFEGGEYLVPRRKLAQLIEAYLDGAPGIDDADGDIIVREIAAQHGLLVERTRDIWSFSHLTLQEYFAASYIVANEARGTVRALRKYLGDDRWREVFLLTAGMLGDATAFAAHYSEAMWRMIAGDVELVRLLTWGAAKSTQVQTAYAAASMRAFYLDLALSVDPGRTSVSNGDLTLALDLALDLDRDLALALASALALDRALDHALALDLVLTRALDRALALDLDLARALDRDLALASALALDLALARALDRASARALDRALALDLALALALDRDLALALALDRARDLARAIELAEHMQLDALGKVLKRLRRAVPADDAGRDPWQVWSAQLRQVLMAERNIGHEWEWTKDRAELWERYLAANLLFVHCLDIAYLPSDKREAFKDNLLLPPPT